MWAQCLFTYMHIKGLYQGITVNDLSKTDGIVWDFLHPLSSSPVQMELHFSQVLYAQITLVFHSYSLWIKERYFWI